MKPTLVLAIDQGTTGTTVLIYDRAGRVVGRAYSEFRQYYPKPGWVEHDPEEIWTVTLGVVRKALRTSRTSPKKLAAIGITNQRETAVVWSRRTGKAIARAIVWQDRRTAPLCADLKSRGLIETFRHKTGLVIDPYFSATKVRWLLDHVKGAQTRAEEGELCFGTIDPEDAVRLSEVSDLHYPLRQRAVCWSGGTKRRNHSRFSFRLVERDYKAGWTEL